MKGRKKESSAERTKGLVRIAVAVALTAALSQISIPLPSGVPLTLQTFAVALTGFFLGCRYGLAAVGVYVLLGVCGAPVFASFTGGAYKLADLTGGFIWGFFPVVALAGMGSSRPLSPVSIFLALTGLALCHMLGVGQYALVTGNPLPAAAVAVSLPYIAKDVLSVLLAAFAARAINARMGRDARSEAPLMRKIKNIS